MVVYNIRCYKNNKQKRQKVQNNNLTALYLKKIYTHWCLFVAKRQYYKNVKKSCLLLILLLKNGCLQYQVIQK